MLPASSHTVRVHRCGILNSFRRPAACRPRALSLATVRLSVVHPCVRQCAKIPMPDWQRSAQRMVIPSALRWHAPGILAHRPRAALRHSQFIPATGGVSSASTVFGNLSPRCCSPVRMVTCKDSDAELATVRTPGGLRLHGKCHVARHSSAQKWAKTRRVGDPGKVSRSGF
jgi:hypothetical protein